MEDVYKNFQGFWDRDMSLPVKDLSPEENMMLFNWKLRALQPPREPVRLIDVDESVRIQVQEVQNAVASAHKKIDQHLVADDPHRNMARDQIEMIVQERVDAVENMVQN